MNTNIFKTGLMAIALIAFNACDTSDKEVNKSNDDAQKEHFHSDGEEHSHEEHATYQCPMKCEGEKTYAEAGKCPVCKMDLKEVE